MAGKLSPKEKEYMDRIYKREMELIGEGKDPEVAHAIAVAEDALPELERLNQQARARKPSGEAGVTPSKRRT